MLYNRLPRRSLWDEFDRLEREVGQLFNAYSGLTTPAPDFPSINIWTNDEGSVITAELPGVEPKNLEIQAGGDTLTISGERKAESIARDTRVHRQERENGCFVRTIELPFPVQVDRVDAKLERGILNIYAPRMEADKPKKISISTSN
jgi:HSP20 family protein